MNDSIGKRMAEARKAKGLTQNELAAKLGVSFQAVSSWENDTFIPDTWNLIELAKILDVSVSSLVERKNTYAFKTKKCIYNLDHMKTFIKTSAKTNKLKNSLKALDFACKVHEKQKRKNSDIPYIYHPLNVACHLLAMGIVDDDVISAALLHDVVEDCAVKLEDLPCNDKVKELVRLLSHEKTNEKNRKKIMDKYFKDLSKNPKAVLVKCVDRCNNLTTMSWGLSRDRIYRCIDETGEYILPLIKNVLKKEEEYNDAAWLLSYQIESTLDIYKRLM